MATYYWRPLASGHAWGDSVWSTTDSGGAGTLGPPTSADNAYFSSNDTSSCAINATANCLDLDCTKGTGWTGTLSGSAALNVYGNFTLSAGMTSSATGTISFNATTSGKTITTAGVSMAWGQVNFSNAGGGGGWTLQDNFTCSNVNCQFTPQNGTRRDSA